MKKINHSFIVTEYESREELGNEDNKLLQKAVDAVKKSYAPYSAFHVGAAVLLENGEIVTGNNQENAAYPSGLCAERVALFYASSVYPDVPVKAIAITAKAENFTIDEPVAPCGACRQVMAETENRFKRKLRVIMMGEKGVIQIVEGMENLLPSAFHAEELKKEKK
jgi:cytidine deaminase